MMCRIFGHRWRTYRFRAPFADSYCTRCAAGKTERVLWNLEEIVEDEFG